MFQLLLSIMPLDGLPGESSPVTHSCSTTDIETTLTPCSRISVSATSQDMRYLTFCSFLALRFIPVFGCIMLGTMSYAHGLGTSSTSGALTRSVSLRRT